MGSHHEVEKKQRKKGESGFQGLVRLVTFGLVVAAVVKELRSPPADRHWNGKVAGFVPYDFRMPTVARFRERVWAPESEHLVSPHVFGVGWTLNVGRLYTLVRERIQAAD